MIELKNLSKSYGQKVVLKNLNFKTEHIGQIYTILGPSGSGKSTLLNILFGIDREYSGKYFFNGKDTSEFKESDWDSLRKNTLQIVYQDFKLIEDMTVLENIELAAHHHFEEKRVMRLLKQLDLADTIHSLVKNLSGGQKQRVALVRALVNNPQVLLLDEPTGNLDDEAAKAFISYINSLKRQGVTVILITHDSRIIPFSDKVYRLSRHRLLLETKLNTTTSQKKKIKRKEHSSKYFKYPLMTYLFKRNKRDKGSITISMIPTTLLLMLFILIFTIFYYTTLGQISSIYDGLSDTALFIDSANITNKTKKEYQKNNITLTYDQKRLFFSQSDITNVEKSKLVKKATLLNGGSSTIDNQDNILKEQLDKESFPDSLKKYPSIAKAPNNISLEFQSLEAPKDFIDSYNKQNIHLVKGDFPKTNSNDILIPEFYAMKLNSKNYLNMIGKTINLNVAKMTDDGKEEKTHQSKYKIVGIYQSTYKEYIDEVTPLYTGYTSLNKRDLDYLTSQENYELFKKMIQTDEDEEFFDSLFKNQQSFKKAIGSGDQYLLVVANHKKDIPKLKKELQTLFPNYAIHSNQLINNDYPKMFQYIIFILIIGSLIISLVSGIIMIFINKSMTKKRSKEFAILYSLGYGKRSVRLLIILENFLFYCSATILSYIILKIINRYIIQFSYKYDYLNNIFTPKNIIFTLLFILVISFISTLWSLANVKQKKLIENLK